MGTRKRRVTRVTFSEHYKLGKNQLELDFVDVPVNGPDIRLFIDPYALSRRKDPWHQACADEVYGYFDHLLDLIRLRKKKDAMKLLDGLHESNETKLGYSPRNQGAGIGHEQAEKLYKALEASNAVQTGVLKDIEEVNLMIPGIDRDKVSDITTNIIKKHLIKYTQDQCELHGIKSLTDKPIKNVFMYEDFSWHSDFYKLPSDTKGSPVILVPKAIVRIIPALDAQEYYQHYVLNYLQAELHSAGSSLGRLLKDGSRAKPPKSSITEEVTHVGDNRKSKNKKSLKTFLYEFNLHNEQILNEYEEVKIIESRPLENEQIEEINKDRPQNYDELINKLKSIPPGKDTASEYHNYMVGSLSAIFYPLLTKPKKEKTINDGIKRIDISFINSADYGFFSGLRELKGIPASYVTFECKNYWKDLANPEVDQIATRLSPKRGQLGFLVYRSISDRKKLIKRCKMIASDGHGFVVPLCDKDIIKMLELKRDNKDQGLDGLLEKRLREIID